jgi:hypothetical protein
VGPAPDSPSKSIDPFILTLSSEKSILCATCGTPCQLNVFTGFVVAEGGLTYVGPAYDFPKRFLRQALCGLEMSEGRSGLIAFLENQLAVLKRGET